jgi:hypothetical protein
METIEIIIWILIAITWTISYPSKKLAAFVEKYFGSYSTYLICYFIFWIVVYGIHYYVPIILEKI